MADFTQYWVHRTFHAVPALWRFHAVHHSAEQMDWLAGSRLHLVDIAVTRGLTYVPIYVLGFAEGPLLRVPRRRQRAGDVHPRQRALRLRSAEVAGRDAAVSSLASRGGTRRRSTRTSRCICPVLDRGVRHDASPRPMAEARMASSGGPPVPDGFLRQLLWPLHKRGQSPFMQD